MLSIQFILFIGFLLALSYLVGRIFHAAEKPVFFPELVISGFVVILALFQLISTPLMGFHAPFSFSMLAFWLMIACLVILFVLQTRKNPNLIRIPRMHIEGNKIVFGAAILLVLAQVIIVTVFHFDNSDDSFYVSSVLTTINSPAIYSIDPSTGDPNFPVMAQYRYESWELLQAVFSKSFSIAPATLAHSILPFGLVLLSYLAYAVLAKELLPVKYISGFILSLSIFHLLSGYSDYSAGTFLLTRIWQGKSVLLHIGIPYLLAILLQWHKSEYDSRQIWKVLAIILFSISLNPIAIFLPPLIIAGFMGIGLILNFDKRKEILLMGASIIPLALYALVIRSGMLTSSVNLYPLDEFSLSVTINRFMGSGWYFYIIYLIGMAFLFRRVALPIKITLVYLPLIFLATAWNPIFTEIIAKQITSFPTYWRLYWLFPLGIGFAYVVVELFRYKRLFGFIFICGLILFSLVSHNFVWKLMRLPENSSKLPAEHITLASIIESHHPDALVIAPEKVAVSLRQVTPNLRLFWSRQNYMQEFLDNGKKNSPYKQRLELEAIYTFNDNWTSDEILKELDQYKIELIVVPREKTELLAKLNELEQVYSGDNYLILAADPN